MIVLDLLSGLDIQVPDWFRRYIKLGYALAGFSNHIAVMVVPRIQFAAVALSAGIISRMWEERFMNFVPAPGSRVLFFWRDGSILPGKVRGIQNERTLCIQCLAGTKRYQNTSFNGVSVSKIAPFELSTTKVFQIPAVLRDHPERNELLRFLSTGVKLCTIAGRIARLKYELENSVSSGENTLLINDIVRCKEVRDSLGMPGRMCMLKTPARVPHGNNQGQALIVEVEPRTDVNGLMQSESRILIFLIDRSHPEAERLARNIDDLCAGMPPEQNLLCPEEEFPLFCEILVLRR